MGLRLLIGSKRTKLHRYNFPLGKEPIEKGSNIDRQDKTKVDSQQQLRFPLTKRKRKFTANHKIKMNQVIRNPIP